MTTKSVGASAGWHWILRAVNLGGSNPKAVFGGAALMLAVVIVVALVFVTAVTLLIPGTGPDDAPSFAASLLVTLPILLVMACLMVGYLRLIHAVENGQPASATGVFAGFGDMRTSLRAIAFILLLAIVQNALILGLLSVLMPDMAKFYMQGLQLPPADGDAQQLPALPSGFGAGLLLIWLVALVTYAVQAIGTGQIALAGRGVFAAIGDGLSGAFRNLPALLVLLVVGIAATIAAGLALMLLAMLLMLLSELIGGWILVVLGVPLYFAILLAAIVIAFGVMYHLWRDICGDSATAVPATPDDSIAL